MIAHIGPVPVEELLALVLGGGTAWAIGVAWVRARWGRPDRGRRAAGRGDGGPTK